VTEDAAAHPGPGELAAFDAGTLSPAARAAVERHVATCADCCRTIDGLPEDGFVTRVRALAGAPGFPPELADHPRYRVRECVGAGGMGVVYRATHRVMDRPVALKVIHRRLSDRPAFVEHFRREVRVVDRLSHPNLVTAHDADSAGELHFLVMEYVEGETLDCRVARDGSLPVALACDVVRQAARGLEHAHEQGLVHRDVKPGNLILTRAGAVKVLDFGLAQFAAAETPVEAPSGSAPLVGTPDYLAPEQARDPAAAGARADIYGLGCTLYFLLTGQPPFPGGTVLQKLLAHQDRPPRPVAELRPDVPAALAALLGRMLAKDPAARPPTAAAVAEELTRLTAPDSVPPRRRGLRSLLLLFPLPLAAAALYLGWHLTRPTATRPDPPAVEQTAPAPPVASVVPPEEVAREKTEMRNRAVDWLRENVSKGRDSEPVTDTAAIIDRDLGVIDGFQVEIGPRLLKSDRPTLLVGRAGTLQVFELTGGLARDFPVKERGIHVSTYRTSTEQRRATPRVVLSDAAIEGADALPPGGRVKGSVAYRVRERWPGESSLRLTCYLARRRRSVLIPQFRLPESEQGTIPFSFPPVGDAKEMVPGPLVLFVEVITKEEGVVTVESNAAAAVAHVALP
jgi:serine/threonine protein kinase